MTVIRVNPASVHRYGATAQSEFHAMSAELSRLADDVVSVHYFGPNAVAFKTQCGRLAETFARDLRTNMGQMADAIRQSTSNIAASLGGQPISIEITDRPVTAPTPAVVDYVDVDTAALEALIPVVDRHFANIVQSLGNNLSALHRTDWQGNARENAVAAVAALTQSATGISDEAKTALTSYIRNQIDSAVLADA